MIKTVVQALSFLGVSLGLHIGVAAWVGYGHNPKMTGAEGAGDAGLHRVSLAAAPQELAILVEDWTRPPEVNLAATPLPQPFAAPQIPSPRVQEGMMGAAAADRAYTPPALSPQRTVCQISRHPQLHRLPVAKVSWDKTVPRQRRA